MDQPLVSVIVPVYNGEAFLAQALQSVAGQTYRPWELIAVDDGSTDGSAAILRALPGVQTVHQSNQGVAAARNAGLAKAAGSLFAFLDQDDFWTPDKLAVQVRYLQTHDDIGYVLAQQQMFLEPGTPRPSWLRPEHLEAPQPGFLPGTLMVRREVMDAVGRLDPRYRSGDDADWFARAQDAGVRREIMPDVLLHRRIHAGNLSGQVNLAQDELLKALHASIRRKHAGQSGGRE